jgi:hypothetical protein
MKKKKKKITKKYTHWQFFFYGLGLFFCVADLIIQVYFKKIIMKAPFEVRNIFRINERTIL